MENSSFQGLPLYSCLDEMLLRNQVTTEFWSDAEQTTEALTSATFTLIFFLISTPSNILIIVSIIWQRLYKEPTHLLLLNLAISDLLFSILVMPFTIVAGVAGEYIFGSSDYTRCKMCQTGVIISALIIFSLHILAVISLDRCLFIQLSFRYEMYVTVNRTVAVVTFLWVLSVLLALPPLFGLGDMDYTYGVSTCTPRFQYSTAITKNIYYILLLIVEALLPIGLIFVTNAWVICIVQKHLAAIYKIKKASKTKQDWQKYKESLKDKLDTAKNRKQLRLMCVFGGILMANIVTWIPLISRSAAAWAYGSDAKLPVWTFVVVYLCLTSHSFIHPLIQASLIPEIRRSCVSLARKLFYLCTSCSKTCSPEGN